LSQHVLSSSRLHLRQSLFLRGTEGVDDLYAGGADGGQDPSDVTASNRRTGILPAMIFLEERVLRVHGEPVKAHFKIGAASLMLVPFQVSPEREEPGVPLLKLFQNDIFKNDRAIRYGNGPVNGRIA